MLLMSLESQVLAALAAWRTAPAWRIALSGGLDSTVLLHLLVKLRATHTLPPLSAIHIHHGLQPISATWITACQALCQRLDVPLKTISVQVLPGASMERAARDARYQAWEQQLAPGEVLLLAQHQDDQAETLLLRLLRGAGVRGLAAMPSARRLGAGYMCRPLLRVPRAALAAWAAQQSLSWCEDPSNQDTRIARNFLRHRIFPVLREQWPAVSSVFARNAEQCADADALLAELADMDLHTAAQGASLSWLQALPSLAVAPLRALSETRQRNALRHWLQPFTPLPERNHWHGWRCLRDAAPDAMPRWVLASGEVRRDGERLWWLSGDWLVTPEAYSAWPTPPAALVLPHNGRVWLEGTFPHEPLCIRYRQGGERVRIRGRGQRDLKRLLQECGVPAFVRERLPLLYNQDGDLLAVANVSLSLENAPDALKLCWLPPCSGMDLS